MPTKVTPESLIDVLGLVYVHKKTSDGGELYLTRFGSNYADLLEVENWYDREWFETHRERLEGTSAVYRVPTKQVDGRRLELVVKNCRVGEDIPLETRTLLEFINAEFNSPWEEFSLVTEMRGGKYGPSDIVINTQEPLAIYVPPEKMQLWQSGRSKAKINRIRARHSGIDLDILRQYKLVYGWIAGKDAVAALKEMGYRGDKLKKKLIPLTKKAIADIGAKGYVVADMKPNHVIIGEDEMKVLDSMGAPDNDAAREEKATRLSELVEQGRYSVIDYELLMRTPEHEEEVSSSRRHSYLDEQQHRFRRMRLPPHLKAVKVFGVPYLFGHAESTGGALWVVGRNPRLFDYFLPERWRKTHSWRLSENNEVFYTFTKDHVHIVWKTSRVGEDPPVNPDDPQASLIGEQGFNSPFEEFAMAHYLSNHGIPTVYVRAIYMTGSLKQEKSADMSRYESHRDLMDPEGHPILREDRNYITLRGYYNGPDSWVAKRDGILYRPVDLQKAVTDEIITPRDRERILGSTLEKLKGVGYDGTLLHANDLLLALAPTGDVVLDSEGVPEVRISNFEQIRKL